MALSGCSQPLVEVANPLEIDKSEYTRMYHAAMGVLRDYGFRLDRRSHRFGTVTTKDMGCSTVFEPWQRTNSTDLQAWESTINQQRRHAVITLEPTGLESVTAPPSTDSASKVYRLRVEVFLERVQMPTLYLPGSTSGHGVLGVLRSVPTEWADRGIDSPYWRPMGRDPLLEQRLLADIVRRSVSHGDQDQPG